MTLKSFCTVINEKNNSGHVNFLDLMNEMKKRIDSRMAARLVTHDRFDKVKFIAEYLTQRDAGRLYGNDTAKLSLNELDF